jgi:hypothetical protein
MKILIGLAVISIVIVGLAAQPQQKTPIPLTFSISPDQTSKVLKVKIKQAELTIEACKGHLRHMKRNLDRIESLPRRARGAEEYDIYLSHHNKAKDDLEMAKLKLEEYKVLLGVMEEMEGK